MTSTLKETISSVNLSMEAIRLREKGFDRFKFRFNAANKKLIDLVAWRYHARPDKMKKVE